MHGVHSCKYVVPAETLLRHSHLERDRAMCSVGLARASQLAMRHMMMQPCTIVMLAHYLGMYAGQLEELHVHGRPHHLTICTPMCPL